MKTFTKMATATAVLAVVGTSALVYAQGNSVSIKGSDTMLIINQRWAEAYAKVSPNANISVTGGGSSIGINSFINGVAEIAASSRTIRKSEIDRARSRGSVSNEIAVALDGLAIAVNDDNSVDSLMMDELRRIYVGQITNWNQVGGKNEPITVLSRDSNSGTYAFFQQNVLRNQNWGKGVRFLPSTSEELREVQRGSGAIAYGGVAYFKGKKNIKILNVAKSKGSTPLAPNEANVRNKSYPIWRYLYFYTNGAPKGETAKFVKFVLSPQGQKIVEEVGYYSLK